MSDVLDSIDGALRDYETSADAMRWTPDPQVAAKEVAHIIMSTAAWQEFARQITASFYQSMRQLGEEMMPLITAAQKIAHLYAAQDRRHRNRCRTCNPAGNPPPFPGGAEYHRRRKARARRRRR